MITTNANFDTANAALAKRPIYALSIGGQARVYTSQDLTELGVTNQPGDWKPWLKTPRGASQSIDVVNGTTSIGEMECEVVDVGGALRTLIGGNTLEGSSATLRAGYPAMSWTDFVVLHTQKLYKLTPTAGYTSWMLRARDTWMNAKRTVYANPLNGAALSPANPWIIQGTPSEIFQAMYLFGLQGATADLDLTALRALDAGSEGLYRPVRPFLFVLTEPVEVKQWLEAELFKPAGLYPVVDHLGRLSVRAFRAPAAGPTSLFTFDDTNITVLPGIDRMPITNEIVFSLDLDLAGGGSDTKTKLIFVDGTSISLYGRSGQRSIESKGLRSEWGAQWFCQEMATRMFRRFAGTPAGLRGGAPLYDVQAFLLTLPVWVGDYVNVTHPLMPNITSGALGVTNRLMEVIDRSPEYSSGRMRYKLLDTGLTGQAAAYEFSVSDRDLIIGTNPIY